jgi:DNA-binding transcriptional ArsR family regulator
MATLDPGASDGAEEFDTWKAMQVVTQQTRASIVADLVGHPRGMASVLELDYVNPDVHRSAISEHLDKLQEAGIVAKAELPVGERARDLPYVFYYVTDEARAFFDRNGIYDPETWAEQYAKVEKTEAIERIEGMERPERE